MGRRPAARHHQTSHPAVTRRTTNFSPSESSLRWLGRGSALVASRCRRCGKIVPSVSGIDGGLDRDRERHLSRTWNNLDQAAADATNPQVRSAINAIAIDWRTIADDLDAGDFDAANRENNQFGVDGH